MRSRSLNSVEFVTRLLILAVFLTGCAGQANNLKTAEQPRATLTSGAPLPVPEELKEKVRLSEELGEELYIIDKVATIGTDVMLENVKDPHKAGICGYIVVREGNEQNRPTGSWWVEFFVDQSEPKIGYKVYITPPATPGPATKKFEAVTPPAKPMEGEINLHRSIRTAIEAVPDRPNQPCNPVVMPGAAMGEDGNLVYLLAGTTRDNVVVFGKHYRVLVSNDGKSAIRVDPLTKSVFETDAAPANAVALVVTHLLGDYPLETHVFINKLHKKDLYVSTEKYLWRISKGKIDLMGLTKDKNKSQPPK